METSLTFQTIIYPYTHTHTHTHTHTQDTLLPPRIQGTDILAIYSLTSAPNQIGPANEGGERERERERDEGEGGRGKFSVSWECIQIDTHMYKDVGESRCVRAQQ